MFGQRVLSGSYLTHPRTTYLPSYLYTHPSTLLFTCLLFYLHTYLLGYPFPYLPTYLPSLSVPPVYLPT